MTKSPHLDAEWLRRKYEVECLSTYEIAKLVNRDPTRIHEKLRDFGIPTRPRGHNLHGKDNSWAKDGYEPHWKGRKHSEESRAKLSQAAARPRPWLRGSANGMFGVTGAQNPNWKGGLTPERQRVYASAEWQQVRREVLERDQGTCLRCGIKPNGWRSLHLHHVKSWNDAPEHRLDKHSIATLCRRCHEWVHSGRNCNHEWLDVIQLTLPFCEGGCA